jgi:MFS family permease
VKNRPVVLLLGAGQFVMVLDSSVMNVSISQLVTDLDTTVPRIQLAITAYTLVMASLMLIGGKIGDLIGSRRTFVIGLTIYGAGSLITAAAPNFAVLLFGWSFVEGLGAILVIPSVASLTAANFQSRERALAYGVLGGVAAAGVAIGPLIGGWVTSNFTWRYVFVAETIVVGLVISMSRVIGDARRDPSSSRLDIVGAVLSAAGLGTLVFAVLQSSSWGWVEPRRPPEIAGKSITPFGFSPAIVVMLVGVLILFAFTAWQRRRVEQGASVLVDLGRLTNPQLRNGLMALSMQQLALAGTFFVVPLYLQVVLGFDAFKSGKVMMPLSVCMFVAALGGPIVLRSHGPRRVVRVGQCAMFGGELLLLASLDFELRRVTFALALGMLGVGIGLIVSQLGNVVMSTAAASTTSETGGMQGTATNLGASLGTALIGSLLLTGLAGAFTTEVAGRSDISEPVRVAVEEATSRGLDFVPVSAVERVARDAGLPDIEVDSLTDAYRDGQLRALRSALGAIAVFVLVGFAVTRRLPADPLVANAGT